MTSASPTTPTAFALSEATDGAGAGAPSVFGVILGTGVGGGITVNGALVSGPNAIAGEWGHNSLPFVLPDEMPGPHCYCGKKGCIESWLSGSRVSPPITCSTPAKPSRPRPSSPPRTRATAPARLALRRYADRLARALAHVVNILDPHVIVLGGGMSNIAALYDEVPARWGAYVFSDTVATRLARHAHGDASGVRGAAWLWPEAN